MPVSTLGVDHRRSLMQVSSRKYRYSRYQLEGAPMVRSSNGSGARYKFTVLVCLALYQRPKGKMDIDSEWAANSA